jgi:multidrug resistance efflux pump
VAIRRLRLRELPESLPNEIRSHRQAVIRIVYFATIFALALWLGNMFLGGFFYLRSEGQVLGAQAVVAIEFPATVRDIHVDVGARVVAGQVVAVVSSQSVTDSLARLKSEQADRALRLGDMRIRSETVNAIIDLARTRETVATDTRHRLETLLPGGFLPLDKRTAALENEFRSRQDLAQLQAEQGAMAVQVTGLEQAAASADDAIAQLRQLYDGGLLRSPIDGIVGGRLAEDGTVLTPGQPLLVLYKDARFIQAFLPTGGLFSVSTGDHVVVSTGLQSFSGIIARIEPVAAMLPGEFQRAFATVDRQQLIRIAFDPDQVPPPLFTKVAVRSAFSWPWGSGFARVFNH